MNPIILSAIISSIITILAIRYINNRTSDNYYISPIVDENMLKKDVKETIQVTVVGVIAVFVFMQLLIHSGNI